MTDRIMDSKKGPDYRTTAGLKKMSQVKSNYWSMEDEDATFSNYISSNNEGAG